MTGRTWDAVIVGAGPAGAATAIELAGRGARPLLLDKDSFPRDKVCGDGLIAAALDRLGYAGVLDRVVQKGHSIRTMQVYSPSRHVATIPAKFLTLQRSRLDKILVERAIEAGAVFLRGKAIDLSRHADGRVSVEIAGRSAPVTGRVCVIATGASTSLCAQAGIQPGRPSGIALRCYIRSSYELDSLLISYDKTILPGYAWIFPLGQGRFNVGCGIFLDGAGPSATAGGLKGVLKRFLTEFPVARRLLHDGEIEDEPVGFPIRCGLNCALGRGRGRLLGVGEAIETTFHYTGEGIGKAMESGFLAARAIGRALDSGDFGWLDQYPSSLESELKPKYAGYRVAQRFVARPWLLDQCIKLIGRRPAMARQISGIVSETVNPRDVLSMGNLFRQVFALGSPTGTTS